MSGLKLLATAFCTLLLQGCGGDLGEDFAIDVDASPAETGYALSSLHGGMMVAALGLAPVRQESSGNGSIYFVIPGGDNGDGTLEFTTTKNGKGGTRVGVTLDLPFVSRPASKGTEFLSEGKAERILKRELLAWARSKKMGSDGQAQLDKIDDMIGALAIAVQKWDELDKPDILLANADYEALFDADEVDSSEIENFDDDSSYGTESDPSFETPDYDQPTDSAFGYGEYEESDGGWGEAG